MYLKYISSPFLVNDFLFKRKDGIFYDLRYLAYNEYIDESVQLKVF